MLFKINDIGEDGLSFDLAVTPAWLAEQCPDLEARPGQRGVRAKGRLVMAGDDVVAHGTLRGELDTTCARCLEPAQLSLDLPLDVTFLPRDDGEGDSDEVEDEQVGFYDGDQVDLGPEIRDQILLAMPVGPLCKETCAGLCPVCGGNRNQTPCDCEARARLSSSPLAALGKLKV
jgi:uncharacterized protein